MQILPILPEHAIFTAIFPAINQDPLDRLLVTLAPHKPMHLITNDVQLDWYGVMIMKGWFQGLRLKKKNCLNLNNMILQDPSDIVTLYENIRLTLNDS